jgi:hypothetical protein
VAPFRLFLILVFSVITLYTGVVIMHHGMSLLPVFFGDMAAMAWPGQFNLDFLCMLMLSSLWVAWRHRFTPVGCVLGLLALFLGSFFLSLYLLVESRRCGNNLVVLLTGQRHGCT